MSAKIDYFRVRLDYARVIVSLARIRFIVFV